MAPFAIDALDHAFDVELTVPGSKSLTNRALLASALATGRSTITNVLVADDAAAMADAAVSLGASVHSAGSTVVVDGTAGDVAQSGTLAARQSGTTARFVAPVVATRRGPWRLDGDAQLRARPMGDLFEALERLGATVVADEGAGALPCTITGPITGGAVSVRGSTTSQFISGLLLAAPLVPGGLEIHVLGTLVSRPFVDMSVALMRQFGAHVEEAHDTYRVAEGGYSAADVHVEPDATAASYLFAAAALTGGRVRVPGLGSSSRQGDLDFARLLGQMGADVEIAEGFTEVTGTGSLHGIVADCADMPDIVPTLAVVAAFASGATVISGVEHIRGHESDRITGLVAQLRALGVGAEERPDGLVIEPAPVRPTLVVTYGDQRMAMAFAVMGLVVEGISIDDPECVAKTFPEFFTVIDRLRS